MRRIVAVFCCILWLGYGNLSGLAHTHLTSAPDEIHGLGLDHAHESTDHHPTGHDHADVSRPDRLASDAHHDATVYLTAHAVKPGARIVMASIDMAGEPFATRPAPSDARHVEHDLQPHDPPSKKPPGLRAPPS